MYDRYPPGNNYQVVFNSQFGVINYCKLNLLSENQFIHGIEVSYIPVHSHDIQVIARDLGFASVSGDNLDIMFVPGYNYNIYIRQVHTHTHTHTNTHTHIHLHCRIMFALHK